jgi:alkylation response protein AidB-like acyl-CoA dehydrogenase
MDLEPTQEQQELVATVGGVLEGFSPASASDAERRRIWSQLTEIGLFQLGLDEDLGGAGYGLPEEALVFEQLGRSLAAGPFVATLLAARLAALSSSPGLVNEITSADQGVALALPYATMPDFSGPLSGEWSILDGSGATLALIVHRDGARLVRMEDFSDLVQLRSTDQLSSLARGTLTNTEPVASADGDEYWLRGMVLTAALLAGIARGALTSSVDYVSVREQFGQPVGMFQAVKHRCAEMAVRTSAAESIVRVAAQSVGRGYDDADEQAASAKVVAAPAAIENATANILNHGGMGFTKELGAHLYVRRATALRREFGTETENRRLLVGV